MKGIVRRDVRMFACFATVLALYRVSVTEADPRIVGGTPVIPEDGYPFMAVIYKKEYSGALQYVCCGSLVSQNAVLTAAHCASYANAVAIGKYRYDPFVAEDHELFYVKEKIIHPSYNPAILDNDMVLLKLDGNSSYSPVVLHDGNNADVTPGQPLIVMGWGKTSSGGSVSEVLMETEVEVVSNGKCSQNYAVIDDPITQNMLCAAGEGTDACQGDSGGPIITADGRNIQVGTVSSGEGCADPDFPGIYARLGRPSTIEWVQSVLSEWSHDKEWEQPTLSPSISPLHPSDAPSTSPTLSRNVTNNFTSIESAAAFTVLDKSSIFGMCILSFTGISTLLLIFV